ncbi:MAG: hypothetical protein IJO06_01140, partial [Thermoguttaceae bacterium]|nr:hypothetical protein [Thermoguttaceae bacterium]
EERETEERETEERETEERETEERETEERETEERETEERETEEREAEERETEEREAEEREAEESQELTASLANASADCDATSTVETLYPGSFNPPHRAHRRVAELAAEKTGAPVAFELSVRNVDKPSLDALEISRRLEALREAAPNVPIWTTNAPRFVEKAALFPGSTFALGTDSVVRLGDAKYENGSTSRRDAVLERLAESGAKFLVFTRKIDGAVVEPESLPLPERLRSLCEFVPPEEFLDDVSSTALRQEARR